MLLDENMIGNCEGEGIKYFILGMDCGFLNVFWVDNCVRVFDFGY